MAKWQVRIRSLYISRSPTEVVADSKEEAIQRLRETQKSIEKRVFKQKLEDLENLDNYSAMLLDENGNRSIFDDVDK